MTLDEMQRICEAATPGPWATIGPHNDHVVGTNPQAPNLGWMDQKQNTDFVVMARAEMLNLIAVAKAAKRYAPFGMDHDHASDCGCYSCELVKSIAVLEAK